MNNPTLVSSGTIQDGVITERIDPNNLPEPEATLVTSIFNVADAAAMKLKGDKHLTDDEAAYDAWRQRVVALLRPIITGVLPTLPEPPVDDRQRFRSVSDLLGEECPRELDEDELAEAVETLRTAEIKAPLNDEEQDIFTMISNAYDYVANSLGGGEVMVRDDHVEDKLNEDLERSSLPEWLNDNINWDDVYEGVRRDSDEINFNGTTYYCLRPGF